MDMDEGKLSAGGGAAVAEPEVDVMSRFSLDVSEGCGGRHSTLLDEYERLAFESQLTIVLRRCYSEPSPVRFAAPEHHHARAPPPPPQSRRGAPDDMQGEAAAARRDDDWGGRFWRLHEVLARWIEALRPVFQWLSSAWECRRTRKQQQQQPDHDVAARRPPPTMPRVRLMDYLRY